MSLLTDIVAYYKLSDTSDATGNGYTLTNNNSVTFDAGLMGNAADFGSSNTNKSLSSSSSYGISSTYSVSIWIKLNAEISSGTWSFINLNGSVNTVAALYILQYLYNSGSREINFGRLRSGVSFDTTTYSLTMGSSNWHHFVVTYDGTTVTLYHNGSSVATIGSSGNGTIGNQIANLTMGADSSGNYSSCKADEVGIWSRTLTSTEVSQLYNGGQGLQYPFIQSGGSFLMNFL